MELTPRLRMIADLVPHGARFADIGTDHAYLPVWLIQNGVIDHAIAADLRQGPLDRARDTAERYSVSEQMDFRLCDGLTGVRAEEADAIAIAGMGGETIAHILSRAPWTRGEGITLLLQPMSSQSDLRRWLSENGYQIVKERIAREEKTLYTILVAAGGVPEKMSEAELLAGRLDHDPLRGEHLELLISKVRRALEGQRAAARKNEDAIRRSEVLLSELTEMETEWKAWQQ